jgi:hypothetical protein
MTLPLDRLAAEDIARLRIRCCDEPVMEFRAPRGHLATPPPRMSAFIQ